MKLNSKTTILGLMSSYEESKLVVFGAPFDGTVSFRPGSRFGPSAMRTGSLGIETFSPYQNADLLDIKGCDAGDLPLPSGDTKAALDMINSFVYNIIQDEKTPIMLGGEHLITLPAIEAV